MDKEQMARKMRISKRVYQKYENEETVPGSDKLEMLSRELNILNPSWLLTGEGPMLRHEEEREESEKSGSIPLNAELLQEIITRIERGLKRGGDEMDPAKKAEVIVHLYKYLSVTGEKSDEAVERVLRMVK